MGEFAVSGHDGIDDRLDVLAFAQLVYTRCDDSVAGFDAAIDGLDDGRGLAILDDGDFPQRYFPVRRDLPNAGGFVANIDGR